jgi:hypothetical protein
MKRERVEEESSAYMFWKQNVLLRHAVMTWNNI